MVFDPARHAFAQAEILVEEIRFALVSVGELMGQDRLEALALQVGPDEHLVGSVALQIDNGVARYIPLRIVKSRFPPARRRRLELQQNRPAQLNAEISGELAAHLGQRDIGLVTGGHNARVRQLAGGVVGLALAKACSFQGVTKADQDATKTRQHHGFCFCRPRGGPPRRRGPHRRVVKRSVKTFCAGLCLLATCVANAGTVEGTVTIRSTLARKAKGPLQRRSNSVGGPLYQENAPSAPPVDEATHVVVYLPATPGGQAAARTVRLEQKNRQFQPHVLPVFQGSTVEFANSDSVYHSVYSQSETRPFFLPEYKQAESRQITFAKPGVVELFCAIHSEMNAYVLVLDSGHFVRPDARHEFRLTGVPAGKRTLKAWHPRLPPWSQVIDVPATGTVRVDLQL